MNWGQEHSKPVFVFCAVLALSCALSLAQSSRVNAQSRSCESGAFSMPPLQAKTSSQLLLLPNIQRETHEIEEFLFPQGLKVASAHSEVETEHLIDRSLKNPNGTWKWELPDRPVGMKSTLHIVDGVSLVSKQRYRASITKFEPIRRPGLAYVRAAGHILLNHGLGRSGTFFYDLVRALVSQGFTVHVIDGINSGRSLELMDQGQLGAHKSINYIHSPSPLDDALIWQSYLSAPQRADMKFTLVGHSRGHAVTSSLLAIGNFDARLVAHIPINPYLDWMLNEPKRSSAGHPLVGALERPWYAWANQLALQGLRTQLPRFELELDSHERFKVSANVAANALHENLLGLRGKPNRAMGFTTGWYYSVDERAHELLSQETDFGFQELVNLGLPPRPLSPPIRNRTVFVASEDDGLVLTADVQQFAEENQLSLPRVLTERLGLESRERVFVLRGLGDNAVLRVRKELRATHLSPSRLPLQVAELIMAAHKSLVEKTDQRSTHSGASNEAKKSQDADSLPQ